MPGIPPTWKEVVEDNSPGGASFEPDGSVAAMVYDIPFADIMNTGVAIGTILGYSYKDPNTKKLRRQLPMQHPYFPNMWASKIAQCTPHTPGTRDSNGNLITRRGAPGQYNPANDSSFKFPSTLNGGSFAMYQWARTTIQFTARDYLLVDDATIDNAYGGDESYRFVSTRFDPTGKFLTAQRGGFKWAETNAAHTVPPQNRCPATGMTKLELTADLTLLWHMVPASGLFTTITLAGGALVWTTPTNIDSIVGTVNNAAFHGYPAGTLLCLQPILTPHVYPISPAALDGVMRNSIPLYYDVGFRFKWYDPAIDPNNNTRGHNTLPYPPNGYSYKVTSINGGRTLYPTGNFQTLFTLN